MSCGFCCCRIGNSLFFGLSWLGALRCYLWVVSAGLRVLRRGALLPLSAIWRMRLGVQQVMTAGMWWVRAAPLGGPGRLAVVRVEGRARLREPLDCRLRSLGGRDLGLRCSRFTARACVLGGSITF